MPSNRYLDKSRIIDYDEKYATVTAAVAASATSPTITEIFKFQAKPGKIPWLTFIGNAIQAGGGDYVTFRLQINRSDYYPFDTSLNQWAPPESNYNLEVPYILPTGCEIRVIAVNSDTAATYAATARVRVSYTDFSTTADL